MRESKIMTLLALALFILGVIGLAASFSFTKEYKEKIISLEQQSKIVSGKIDDFKAGLDDFQASLSSLKNENTINTGSVKGLLDKAEAVEAERKNILTQIASLTKDIQDLQKQYTASLGELKAKMESLKTSVNAISQESSSSVDLGHISVKKGEPVK
jgi:chromosome segregation ATPase